MSTGFLSVSRGCWGVCRRVGTAARPDQISRALADLLNADQVVQASPPRDADRRNDDVGAPGQSPTVDPNGQSCRTHPPAPGGSTSSRVHDRQGRSHHVNPRYYPHTRKPRIRYPDSTSRTRGWFTAAYGSVQARAAPRSSRPGPLVPGPIRTLGATRRRPRVDLVSRACPGPRARRRTAPHQSAHPPRHARLDLVALIDRDGPRSRKQCPAAARVSRQAPAVMTSQPQPTTDHITAGQGNEAAASR